MNKINILERIGEHQLTMFTQDIKGMSLYDNNKITGKKCFNENIF